MGQDDLGNINRKGKSLSHWAMDWSGNDNKFVDESGVSKCKYNLDVGLKKSFRWNEMNIKGFRMKSRTKGN